MDPAHYGQMQRLTMLRDTTVRLRGRSPSQLHRARGDGHGVPDDDRDGRDVPQDPLIYPGVYAPSGFDIVGVLVRVVNRPNPKILLGAIDSSAALLLCDLRTPDAAIVYSSDPFTSLTGYAAADILGLNCRFLQSPDGRVARGAKRAHTDNAAVLELRNRVAAREEAQVTLLNYKKGGIPFVNVLTLIPIRWDDKVAEAQFMVGFQVDRRDCFG